ncbi:putative serine esterase-domain-containing protein [Zopfochytrium polystomum]|nr:putative serine esterase-domain-containing protein [Zopfochytrium polystomum]
MASSDFGCGTGNFWGWLARSLFRGGRDRSIQQQQQQQKQAHSSARVVKYLLEPAKVEEMIRDSSSVRLSRTSFDFEDVRSVFGSEQFQVESLMLAMIGIVQLQSSIVHDFAVFGLTLQSARATVDGPLRLLSSDQILSLLSSGLGPRRMIDSSSLRRDLPAVGDDGRLAVLKGFATLVSPYLKDGSNEKSLRLADICDVVSSKLDALWETYISGFGLVSRKSLIFMRQQSGKKLLARKELYLLGPEPLLGYEAHLAKIWRANKDESFLSECSNTPPAIIFELLRKAAQPTVSFAASIAPTEVLSPNIRRLRAPSRGPQFQISSSPVPFADVRSIDDEASIRGITTASVLSGEASVIVAPAITTRAPSSSFVNVGPRLDDIEVAIDNLRGRGAPSVIERRTSFVGSIGSSAWFPQTDVASVILDPETKTQASAFAPATHLVVFVHGLLGSAFDLRQYRNRSAFWRHWMNIPDTACEFMISSANEDDTFADIEVLADRLVGEIMTFIEEQSIYVERLSFVCHSLGGVIARCAVSKAAMEPFWPKLYSFTSLASPHLSLALHNNSLLNSFIGFYQVIDKSKCLDQLYMKDHHDPRQTLLYRLSCLREGGLGHFKFVRLLASPQDGYVNAGSALAVGEGRPKRWTSPMSCRSEDEEVDFESSPTDVMDFVGGNPSAPAQTRRIYQEMVANFEAQLASGLVGASTSSSTTMPTAATASTITTTTPAAAAGSAAQVTKVEKFLVLFGSVHRSSGWDVVRRRGHVAMLEDSAFIEMLVFINKLHL